MACNVMGSGEITETVTNLWPRGFQVGFHGRAQDRRRHVLARMGDAADETEAGGGNRRAVRMGDEIPVIEQRHYDLVFRPEDTDSGNLCAGFVWHG